MKCLRANSLAGDAWVKKDFGDYTDVWTSCRVLFGRASLSLWTDPDATYSGDFATVIKGHDTGGWSAVDGIFIDGFSKLWQTNYIVSSIAAVPRAWHTVELHTTLGLDMTTDLYIDDVLAVSGFHSTAFLDLINAATFGEYGGGGSDSGVRYIADVKVGTSRGGSEIHADDFSSGDLSAWTWTSGDVSVVDDPLGEQNQLAWDFVRTVFDGGSGSRVIWAPELGQTESWRPSQLDLLDGYNYDIVRAEELGLFVEVGYNQSGTVAVSTSPDGLTWTPRGNPFGVGGSIFGIAWSASLGLLVALGATSDYTGDAIATSPDGIVWTTHGNPFIGAGTFGYGQSATWSEEAMLFVACGSSDAGGKLIATSPDGIVWTSQTTSWEASPYNGSVDRVAYASGSINKWFGFGVNAAFTESLLVSDDAVTWTPVATPADGGLLNDGVYSASLGLLVATGFDAVYPKIITSPDGVTWTSQVTPLDGNLGTSYNRVAIVGSVLMALGVSPKTVAVSSDGIIWTYEPTIFDGSQGDGIAHSASLGYSVAVGYDGTNEVTLIRNDEPTTVVGQFVVAGSSGDSSVAVMLSGDGRLWHSTGVDEGISIGYSLAWSPTLGLLVVLADNGIWTSPDGLVWTNQGSPFGSPNNFGFDVDWSELQQQFVAVGTGDTAVATSPDGFTWTPQDSPLDRGTGVRWIERLGLWIAVGKSGDDTVVLATSPDGAVWTAQASAVDVGLNANGQGRVADSGSHVIAVGDTGSTAAADSVDGLSWEVLPSLFDGDTEGGGADVVATTSLAVAVGFAIDPFSVDSFCMLAETSDEGASWLADPLFAVSGSAKGVAHSPELGLVVVVGGVGQDNTRRVVMVSAFPVPGPSGISIGFSNRTLAGTPTYVPIDRSGRNDVQEYQIDRGRESILNRCEAGTATAKLKNNDGAYDPTNLGSPFAGQSIPLKPIQFAPPHPITGEFIPVFTGFIEEYKFSRQGRHLSDVDLSCVDLFDPLSNAQVVPDGSRGAGSRYYAAQRVNDRMIALLADAGVDPIATDIFEGNVNVQESRYSPGTSFLTAMFDTADAEFPGVSNLYIARDGTFRFRGRLDRFNYTDYDTTSIGPTHEWPRRRGRQYWYLGDDDALEAAEFDNLIPIFDMTWSYGKASIINTALVTPFGVTDLAIPGQRVIDAASRNQYGERAIEVPNLIVLDHPSAGTTGLQECYRYAGYYVDNWKTPRPQIDSIEVHGHMAGLDESRSLYWTFCMEVELGDIVYLNVSNPGGGSFRQDDPFAGYFVEGIHHQVSPLNNGYPRWVTRLDLSPLAAFASFPDPPG